MQKQPPLALSALITRLRNIKALDAERTAGACVLRVHAVQSLEAELKRKKGITGI